MFVMLFLARKEYYFFSLLCLFWWIPLRLRPEREIDQLQQRWYYFLSLSFSLLFKRRSYIIKRTLRLLKTTTRIQRERERERGKKAWLEVSCVCVWLKCVMTETRKRYKKVCEEGDKNSSLFWCFETRSLTKKKIKRTQKEKEEIRISSKYEST